MTPEALPPEVPPAAQPVSPLPETLPPAPEVERFPFWGYLDLVVVVCMGALALILSEFLMLGVGRLLHVPKATQELLAIPAQFLAYALLFTIVHTLFRMLYDRPMLVSMGWVPSRLSIPAAALLGLMLSILVALAGSAIKMPNDDTPMKHLLSNPTGLLLIAAFGTTVGPLCEELIFRGFVQPLLVRTFGVAGGIFLTALPFGLLHLQQYGNAWQSGVLITMVGVVLGLVRHFTKSTRASTYVHMAYNSTLFLALLMSGKALPFKW